jgi:hypothetical protein
MKIASCTPQSLNRKLTKDPIMRPMSVTRAAKQTCPPECPVGEICYADYGKSGMLTKRLNKAANSMESTPYQITMAEAEAIETDWPRDGRPLRLHEVGECADEECAAMLTSSVEWVQKNGGGPAYTYTHNWVDIPRTAWGTVSVLASCETLADVDEAMEFHAYAAALVVDTFEKFHREHGMDTGMIPCPEQTGESPDCASCKLCMRDDLLLRAGRFIGFEVHGIKKKRGIALLGELNQ